MNAYHRAFDHAESELDRELRMVREAIQLVASGQSSRVVLAGIRFGEDEAALTVLDARRAGVRVRPLAGTGVAGTDLVIEPALAG